MQDLTVAEAPEMPYYGQIIRGHCPLYLSQMGGTLRLIRAAIEHPAQGGVKEEEEEEEVL